MKTGVSMGSVIDTKKFKKYRKMTKCNCSICVNREKNGCRFGWEPIKGRCNRFGTQDQHHAHRYRHSATSMVADLSRTKHQGQEYNASIVGIWDIMPINVQRGNRQLIHPTPKFQKVNTIQANRKSSNSGRGRLNNITAQALPNEKQNADDDNSS